MLVTPQPGVDRAHVLQVLDKIGLAAANLRGQSVGRHATDSVNAYLIWATDAVRELRTLVSPADVDRLMYSRRYEHLLAMSAHGTAVIFNLLGAEVDERVETFSAASASLRGVIERWSTPGVFVVADTNVYIEHPQKLDDIDFAELIGARGDEIHLLVPIVVVDELDGLKKSTDAHTRWRASHTLAVLDRVFAHTTLGRSRLRDADFSALDSGGIPRGAITVELVFDPAGHTRLPINDDELVGRTLAIQPLTGRSITILTYDTGLSMRARAAGLHAVKVHQDSEQPPTDRKRSSRRSRRGTPITPNETQNETLE